MISQMLLDGGGLGEDEDSEENLAAALNENLDEEDDEDADELELGTICDLTLN